ncbi:RelA/SpoT domain-containing protein, partial [Marinobacter sp. NFXS9]|uniref:RelA/SpoT domain-containing protein n=1 Tax=Marinobacter sp. NFXS9 TaxID=2818433 RepID=UPI0032DFAB11
GSWGFLPVFGRNGEIYDGYYTPKSGQLIAFVQVFTFAGATNYRNSRFSHELVSSKDYILNPKNTGYRGVHLVYKYYNKRVPEYDGLLIELQIRTRLQHTWATAVETMGLFLNKALKSSEGPDEWLDFFALAGSAFAILEKQNVAPIHEKYTSEEVLGLVVSEADRLNVVEQLDLFNMTADQISNDHRSGGYHIVLLDSKARVSFVESFGRRKLAEANKRYTQIEKEVKDDDDKQVVLVAAGSIDQLRKAYPNYFLDTREFISKLSEIREIVESKDKDEK